MKHTFVIITLIAILMSACTPAVSIPAVTSVPPTTIPAPTSTSAPSPTPTEIPTATQTLQPTATQTPEPTATITIQPTDDFSRFKVCHTWQEDGKCPIKVEDLKAGAKFVAQTYQFPAEALKVGYYNPVWTSYGDMFTIVPSTDGLDKKTTDYVNRAGRGIFMTKMSPVGAIFYFDLYEPPLVNYHTVAAFVPVNEKSGIKVYLIIDPPMVNKYKTNKGKIDFAYETKVSHQDRFDWVVYPIPLVNNKMGPLSNYQNAGLGSFIDEVIADSIDPDGVRMQGMKKWIDGHAFPDELTGIATIGGLMEKGLNNKY